MLILAATLLTLAVVAGTGLALWHLRATDGAGRPPVSLGIAHGVVGAVGLAVLLLLPRAPAMHRSSGTQGFGLMSVVLFAAALASGVAIFALRRRRGVPIMIVVHAGIAICAYVLLLAVASLG